MSAIQRPLQSTIYCYNCTILFSYVEKISDFLFYLVLCDTLEPISSSSADYHTHASRIQRVGLHQYLFEHTNTLLVGLFFRNLNILLTFSIDFRLQLLEARQSHTLNFSVLWLRTVLQRSAVSLIWRQSIVNWLIGIQV